MKQINLPGYGLLQMMNKPAEFDGLVMFSLSVFSRGGP